jgi:Flp pilus assembly protein TadG
MRLTPRQRAGASVVEFAFVCPVTFLLVFGLIVGAMGVFRYQEVATLSRETARYASVHGTKYAADAGTPAPTPADIYNSVIAVKAVGLDLNRLTYSITYDTSNEPNHVRIVNGDVLPVTNIVTVTLTYQWIPEAFLGGVNLRSTSVMPMSY